MRLYQVILPLPGSENGASKMPELRNERKRESYGRYLSTVPECIRHQKAHDVDLGLRKHEGDGNDAWVALEPLHDLQTVMRCQNKPLATALNEDIYGTERAYLRRLHFVSHEYHHENSAHCTQDHTAVHAVLGNTCSCT